MRQNSEKCQKLFGRKRPATLVRIVISNYYRDKSLVDDLTGTGYCKYESRLVLRSTEIQPLFYDLSFILLITISAGFINYIITHTYIIPH